MEKTDRTLRNNQRGWIGLDQPIKIDVLEVTPKLKVEAHYRIKNFGHGPALKVIPIGQFETGKALKETATTVCKFAIDFATGTVPHGPNIKLPGAMGYVLFPNQWHDETIGSPNDPWEGRAEPNLDYFAFIGCAAYIDQFNIVHWTRFCMEPESLASLPATKDAPLHFCALYNDTDESENKNDQ